MAEEIQVAQPVKEEAPKNPRISFYDGEFFGDVIMQIELECGDNISFSVENIPADRRQWLGSSIESQVNRIVSKRVHRGVEDFKGEFQKLFAPTRPPREF